MSRSAWACPGSHRLAGVIINRPRRAPDNPRQDDKSHAAAALVGWSRGGKTGRASPAKDPAGSLWTWDPPRGNDRGQA